MVQDVRAADVDGRAVARAAAGSEAHRRAVRGAADVVRAGFHTKETETDAGHHRAFAPHGATSALSGL